MTSGKVTIYKQSFCQQIKLKKLLPSDGAKVIIYRSFFVFFNITMRNQNNSHLLDKLTSSLIGIFKQVWITRLCNKK